MSCGGDKCKGKKKKTGAWQPQEIVILVKRKNQGWRYRDIAHEIGRTEGSISSKLSSGSVPKCGKCGEYFPGGVWLERHIRKKHTKKAGKWDDDEVTTLVRLKKQGYTHQQIAEKLNRTEGSISSKWSSGSVPKCGKCGEYFSSGAWLERHIGEKHTKKAKKAGKWDDDEVATLVRLKKKGYTNQQIADELNRTEGSISSKWSSGSVPYCGKCGKHFASEVKLGRHTEQNHSKKKQVLKLKKVSPKKKPSKAAIPTNKQGSLSLTRVQQTTSTNYNISNKNLNTNIIHNHYHYYASP